jgi:tetratricopeptide (TPR) repeat protein
MKTILLFFIVLLLPFIGVAQPIAKQDSLNYYKFHAEAEYEMVGDNATSIKWLNKAIRLDPNDDELYLLRAFAKGAIADWKGQEADYTRVIGLDPGNVAAYTGRAACRFTLKKYKESISDYNWLIEVDPTYYGFFFNRGMCKWRLKDKEGACFDYRLATQMGSSAAYVLVMEHCLE